MDHKRIDYFDYLRVLAACSVIILHVAAKYYFKVDFMSSRWIAFAFYDSIVRWGVPIFVMISGALFLNKNISIKDIYKKYILRIIIAFIVWSLIYAIYDYFTTDISLNKAIIKFFNGPNHLWYLKMIVVVYAMIPFLKKIVEDKKIMLYFLFITFMFSFVIPHILIIITTQFDKFHSIFDFYIRNMNLNFILCFAFYFVLGYYLNNMKLSKKTTRVIYILGIIGFITTIVSTILSSHSTTRTALFLENYTVNVLLEAVLIFTLVKNYVSNHKINPKTNSFILKLSKLSFGQYLVHIIVQDTFNMIGFNSKIFNSFIAIPVVSFVIIVISLLISYILNKIPIIKKYIV